MNTDTAEFGFEDENDVNPGAPLGWNGAGDKNFNDIVYHVTGLFLIRPTYPASLRDSIFPIKDTLAAGDSFTIFAQVINDTGGRAPQYDSLVQWSLQPAAGVNTQSYLKTNGAAANNVFHAVTAYQKDTIVTHFTDPTNPQRSFVQTVVVYVKSGADYKVWIEPDANINPNDGSAASLARLRHPDHVPLVIISDTQNVATVDGVVRDMFGNFTHLATAAQWNEYPIGNDTATVTASTPQYVGLIQRIPGVFGTTHAQAQQAGILLWDTTTVDILNGYIKQLRFVNVATGLPIDSITINTDQGITIKLQGILSTDTTNTWIDVTGTWSLAPNIPSDNPIPTTAAGSWMFSPSVPGGPSQLTATTVTTHGVVTAQIPVNVTRAPPSTRPSRCLLLRRAGSPATRSWRV